MGVRIARRTPVTLAQRAHAQLVLRLHPSTPTHLLQLFRFGYTVLEGEDSEVDLLKAGPVRRGQDVGERALGDVVEEVVEELPGGVGEEEGAEMRAGGGEDGEGGGSDTSDAGEGESAEEGAGGEEGKGGRGAAGVEGVIFEEEVAVRLFFIV